MTESPLTDGELDRLQERHPRFDARAYAFVYEAVIAFLGSLQGPRHASPREVADGVRQLALERFGLMARTVLRHWGIHDADDIGRVVYAMVEQGILRTRDEDQQEAFSGALDFEEAFEIDYPWASF